MPALLIVPVVDPPPVLGTTARVSPSAMVKEFVASIVRLSIVAFMSSVTAELLCRPSAISTVNVAGWPPTRLPLFGTTPRLQLAAIAVVPDAAEPDVDGARAKPRLQALERDRAPPP